MKQLNRVVQQMVLLARDIDGLTDAQLLELFLHQGSETSFEVLVRRHGPMVLGLCQRLLHDPHDAADAFQATFLVLVRKAASIVPHAAVGNWLYGVAYRTALKTKTLNARRRARETLMNDMPEAAARPKPVWDDMRPILDQELNGLPDRYRAPLVLCHLEGKSRQEAALQLGCSEGTLSGRLARARELLARRLTRRGLAMSAGAVASLLSSGEAGAAVSSVLLMSTVQAGVSMAMGPLEAAAVSAQVLSLTEGVMHSMWLTNLRVYAAVLLSSLALLGGGMGVVVWRGDANPGLHAATTDVHPVKPLAFTPADAVPITRDKAVELARAAAEKALNESYAALNKSAKKTPRPYPDFKGPWLTMPNVQLTASEQGTGWLFEWQRVAPKGAGFEFTVIVAVDSQGKVNVQKADARYAFR